MSFDKLTPEDVFDKLSLQLNINTQDARFYHFCDILEELINIINIFYVFSLQEFVDFLSDILNQHKLSREKISTFLHYEDKECPLKQESKEKIYEQIETLRFYLQKATEDSLVFE